MKDEDEIRRAEDHFQEVLLLPVVAGLVGMMCAVLALGRWAGAW